MAKGLAEHGHVVDRAVDGRDGLLLAAGETYDLLIVDRMLPGLDGLAIVKTVRAAGVRTPILFLTTHGRDLRPRRGARRRRRRLSGQAVRLRRADGAGQRAGAPAAADDVETMLRVADLELDLLHAAPSPAAAGAIELQPREFRLLEYLMRHAGRIVTRTMLLEQVWDFHFDPKTSIVETHISRLRGKIDRG